MRRDELFPTRFFKTADVEDAPFVGRIKNVVVEEMSTDRGTEKKPVVYFANTDKGLVLNMTNYNVMSEIFDSEETEDWRGQVIELFAADTSFGAKRVRGIRVRVPQRPKAAPRRTRQEEDVEEEPVQMMRRRPAPAPEPEVDDDGLWD